MKKFSLLLLPLIALLGCQENNNGGGAREAAGEAINAPSDYVGANVRAQQQAQVTSATTTVNNAIRMFNAAEGRNPNSLNELTETGYLTSLPQLPRGASYNYNPQTGQLTIDGY